MFVRLCLSLLFYLCEKTQETIDIVWRRSGMAKISGGVQIKILVIFLGQKSASNSCKSRDRLKIVQNFR